MSASRGGILVGTAVVAGLLIFATIDSGGSSGSPPVATTTTPTTPPATNADGTPVTTVAGATETTKAKKSTTTTAAAVKGARSNDQVMVQVLNGSGLQGAATQRTADLRAKGYQVAAPGNASTRTGHVIQCKAGYEKEAEVLKAELTSIGVTAVVEAIPNPLPTVFDNLAHCYVLLGK